MEKQLSISIRRIQKYTGYYFCVFIICIFMMNIAIASSEEGIVLTEASKALSTEQKLRAAIKKAEVNYGVNSKQVLLPLLRLTFYMEKKYAFKDELIPSVNRIVQISRYVYKHNQYEKAKYMLMGGVMLSRKRHDKHAESLLLEGIESFPQKQRKKSIYYVLGVNTLGDLYYRTYRYHKALYYYKRGLLLQQSVKRPDHRKIAYSLRRQAKVNNKLAHYKLALDQAKKSVQLYKKYYPDKPLKISAAMGVVASIYQDMGQYKQALPLYKASLLVYKKTLPEKHKYISISRNNIGSLYHRMGMYDDALSYMIKSLSMLVRHYPDEHESIATSLNNIAITYREKGEYKKALSLALRALEIRKKTYSMGHPKIAFSFNTLAGIYKDQGNYTQALDLYLRSQAIYSAALPSTALAVITVNNNLALLYSNIGKYDQAFRLYKKSLEMAEKKLGGNHPEVAAILGNLAKLYSTLGNSRQALLFVRRSLDIRKKVFAPGHPGIALSMNNLATTLLVMHKYSKALPLLQESHKMMQASLSLSHPNVISIMGNLGFTYEKLGQYSKAIALLESSFELKKKRFPQGHPGIIVSLNNLGGYYLKLHEYQQANILFSRAIASAGQNYAGMDRLLWSIKQGMALLSRKTGNREAAIIWAKQSVNHIQTLRENVVFLNKKLQSGFLKDKRFVYQQLVDMLVGSGRVTEAQIVLQMLKEQELNNSLQRSLQRDVRTTKISFTEAEKKLFAGLTVLQHQQRKLVEELNKLKHQKDADNISAAGGKRIVEIKMKLMPAISQSIIDFLKNLQKQTPVKIKQQKAIPGGMNVQKPIELNLQKALRLASVSQPQSNVVALQYINTREQLTIILSAADAPTIAWQIKIKGKKLREQVFAVRELLRAPQSDRVRLRKHLHQLYQLLIQPVRSELKKRHTQSLVLIPDGVLRYIPFAALYDGKRYLIQDYRLSLFNEAVKKEFNTDKGNQWQLVAMGLSLAVENFPALINVADELQAVTEKSGLNGEMYLNEKFNRKFLLQSLRQNYNVLHLASHFEYVPGRPDASRLFLGDKSSLYLSDIARENMRFDRFSLVTFSACETGLGGGQTADGREMESLGALVQIQGAKSVMVSLWKVEDSSTAKLMGRFYRYHHERNIGKSEALRLAQLKFIKRGEGVLGHPYYWAPFILMGDWR